MRFLQSGPATDVEAAGGKAAALAALAGADFPIPEWFVLTPNAFDVSLRPDQHAQLAGLLAAGEYAALDRLLAGIVPAPQVLDELHAALAALKREEIAGNAPPDLDSLTFAVRSSARDEDRAGHSFAGQLESFLFVPAAEVPARVVDVWRSGFGERVVSYRRAQGLDPTPTAPAVLVQRMVDADVAGVAFSADPVSGRRDVAVVAAVPGLGTGLVSGETDADTFHVDRTGAITSRQIAAKRTTHRRSVAGSGVVALTWDREAEAPALTDTEVQAVAALARRVARFFGRPQDIEWAMEAGRLSLLQARPISSLAALADPAGSYTLWDNSNIAESYSGITTPLTFSFARQAYEEVYRNLCRLLGIPAPVLVDQRGTFRRMLGLIRGRVYYNLISWYTLLALLPGFRLNRRYMEQMMGVKETLPADVLASIMPAPASAGERVADLWRVGRTLAGLLRAYLLLPRSVERFYRRLDAALGTTSPDLQDRRPDQLVAAYRDLERQLLHRWDAPLVNDLFAMIFHGVLRRLVDTWCRDLGDTRHSLVGDLLRGEAEMVSVEPALRVRELAALAAPHPALVEALCAGAPAAVRAAMESAPDFRTRYIAYLERFGDRCTGELKLESPTLHDDPALLHRLVGQLARAGVAAASSPDVLGRQARQASEQRLAPLFTRSPFRRAIFQWVLENARARGRDRENMRFERTRVFGRVRQIMVALGRQFSAEGVLDDPRDIFFLELDEVLGYVEGTAASPNLGALAAARKAEFARYAAMPVPADRFEARGAVHVGNQFAAPPSLASAPAGAQRQGLGCYPGVVRGRVRVVHDPHVARLQPGEILVAERTDPGWVLLFPLALGLIVERGSLLSHAAIVARELGLPTVVGLPGLMHWLQDGDEVELDGARGTVTRLLPATLPVQPSSANGLAGGEPAAGVLSGRDA
jgi:rifampicin phosphotransferase